MISAADAIEEYKDAMTELVYKELDDFKSKMDSINGTIDTMNSLIGDTNLVDENGKLTDRGLAQVALYAQQYLNAKQEAAEYNEAIESLDDALESGLITQDEYNSMLYEYTSAQESAVLASKESRDAILSLVKEGIQAEIDAKNTNENNIPAIFDECVPVIADGYHLNYAKAVDSEGTEIDLLSSGTQYFALYKNVHFITKAVYPVSFVVTPDGLTNVVVKVNGQEVTGSVSLEAGTYPVEVTADNCKVYTGNITITADAATHTQTVAMTYLPADYTKVDEAIAKANALNKDNYKDFTAVESAVKAVVRDKNITDQSEVDAMAKAIEDAIAALQYKGADYTKVDAAIAKANALNKNDYKDFSGVEAAVKAVVRGKNITEQSEVDKMAKDIEDAIAALEKKPASTKAGASDKGPRTGDTSNLALWFALLFVSGGAVIGTTAVSRKKKHNK